MSVLKFAFPSLADHLRHHPEVATGHIVVGGVYPTVKSAAMGGYRVAVLAGGVQAASAATWMRSEIDNSNGRGFL